MIARLRWKFVLIVMLVITLILLAIFFTMLLTTQQNNERINILLPKEIIYLKIWGYNSEADDSIVKVYISFLRKKLKHIRSKVKIAVVRRVGYRLEVEA